MIGIPTKEVFERPAVIIKQPMVPRSQFLRRPSFEKKSYDKKKPIQATNIGRINSLLMEIKGIYKRAMAGRTI